MPGLRQYGQAVLALVALDTGDTRQGRQGDFVQASILYREVFDAFDGSKVVVRTLDAGSDKPLAFAGMTEEDNPALGVRGIRVDLLDRGLLDRQLDALAAAGRQVGGAQSSPWVMAPMVATVDEAQWFADQVAAAGLPKSGVMIEVPAAALGARHVLAPVDFGSLGTNDLAQYTMAADRMLGELSDLLDPWQPAVLDLVKATCDGGAATSSPVGVCGEAAADPV